MVLMTTTLIAASAQLRVRPYWSGQALPDHNVHICCTSTVCFRPGNHASGLVATLFLFARAPMSHVVNGGVDQSIAELTQHSTTAPQMCQKAMLP